MLKPTLLCFHVCFCLQKNIERGLLNFKFGDPSAKMNWVHAENLIQAQILAAAALTPEKNYIAVSKQEKQYSCHWTVDLAPVFHTIITTVVAVINVHVMVP